MLLLTTLSLPLAAAPPPPPQKKKKKKTIPGMETIRNSRRRVVAAVVAAAALAAALLCSSSPVVRAEFASNGSMGGQQQDLWRKIQKLHDTKVQAISAAANITRTLASRKIVRFFFVCGG